MNSINGKWKFCLLAGLACLLTIACNQKAPQETKSVTKDREGVKPTHQLDASLHQKGMAMPKTTTKQVITPEEVKNKWTTVSIVIKDKSSGASVSYKVKPDSVFEIPETNFKLKIGAFLPDFTMDAERITSLSAEPNNPALQVTIYEGEAEKYRGWLFSKFADMHAFEHERYSIILEDKFTRTADKI
jgi:hypothetical protein